MTKKEITRSKTTNIILIGLLVVILLLGLFASQLEVLLFLKPNISDTERTQIHFLDVGQGDAIAINFPNGKVMIVDSGTKEYEKKLQNYLDHVVLKGNKNIDYVLLTHPDIDHSGNMEFILNNYNVGKFYRPAIYEVSEHKSPSCENAVYRNILNTLESKSVETEIVTNKVFYEFDVKINILAPFVYADNINSLSTNDFSPAIIINDNGKKVFLGGDMSEDMEEILIDNFSSDLLDVDILKLSHHGSKYSNSMQLLEITSPQYVVVSSGENTYGHPAHETLKRLLDYDKSQNTTLFDNFSSTYTMGNVVFSLDNDIKRDIIKNIDDYNFVSVYIYVIISFGYILYVLLLPYYRLWQGKRRFDLQNKHYTYYKQREKTILTK